MDQANMLSIVGGLYDKLVADVSDAVICKLKAEGSAQMQLDSDSIKEVMLTLLERNLQVREGVRDIASDCVDNLCLSDLSEFQDLQRDVESLQEKVAELDPAVIDADDSDFADAVREVIRNNI